MGYRNWGVLLSRWAQAPRQSRRVPEGCSRLGYGLLQKDPGGSCLGEEAGVSQTHDACGVFGFHDFQSQVTFD